MHSTPALSIPHRWTVICDPTSGIFIASPSPLPLDISASLQEKHNKIVTVTIHSISWYAWGKNNGKPFQCYELPYHVSQSYKSCSISLIDTSVLNSASTATGMICRGYLIRSLILLKLWCSPEWWTMRSVLQSLSMGVWVLSSPPELMSTVGIPCTYTYTKAKCYRPWFSYRCI
jgi:hypothetical protein